RIAGPVLAMLARAVGILVRSGKAEPELSRFGGLGDRNQKTVILPDIALFIPGSDEPADSAPAIHVHAERLHRPGNNIGAIIARSLEDAKADRIDADNSLCPRRARHGGDL